MKPSAILMIVHGTRRHGWYASRFFVVFSRVWFVANHVHRHVELQPLKRSDGFCNVR
jgi:hypothetical protein